MKVTVEELQRSREESASVGYMTFTKHIKSDKLGLFCFFEGKDSPYYVSRVKSVFTGNYFPIICLNKSKVLKVYDLIDNHRQYDAYKKAFFIDRDFDPSVENEKIYETPCYSIENLYTSSSVFGEILKSEFGFAETDESFERCIKVYDELQREFHRASTLFNAWYACLKYIRNTTNQEMGINLKDSIRKEFITISLNGITSNYDISAIRHQYPDALTVDDETIENKVLEFEAQDKRRTFRGKFEMDFMLKILNALLIDSNTTRIYISKRIKYNITHTQAISQFSQYAETPESLIEYIRACS